MGTAVVYPFPRRTGPMDRETSTSGVADAVPSNELDVPTFYSPGPKGYTDYPALR